MLDFLKNFYHSASPYYKIIPYCLLTDSYSRLPSLQSSMTFICSIDLDAICDPSSMVSMIGALIGTFIAIRI